MSLNTIALKPTMLVDLYHNNLIETNATSVPESRSSKYLGNNQKNILVIVSHSSVPFLPDSELNFLTNVLAACKLSLADIAIVNHQNIDTTEIQNIIHAETITILLFGVEPLSIGLPINFPQFQLQPFNNRKYLFTPELSAIENDKSLKTRLWSVLKVLFGI